MALKWNQFAGSDYYRKLPEAEQGAARRRFFDDQVAPRYSAEQREGAWADFDRRATMMPATVATPAQAPASIQRPQANVAARAAIATAAPEQAAMPQRPVRPGQVQPAASAPAIAAPAGGAGFVEGMKDFGRTAVKSVVQGIPEAAANLADYIDTPEFDASGRQISDDGALSKWARATRAAAEKRGEPWQESTFGQEARAKDDMSWRGGAGAAGESMGLSWGPGLAGAAAGAAIGSMAGGVGAIPGAAAGYAIGSLATLPLFFGAQAKDTYDRVFKQAKIDNPELDDESAHDKAVVAGGFTGLIEAAGERVSDIVGGKLFRLMPPGVKNGMVRAATKSFQGVRQMIADMLKIVGTEVGTELAQGASQSAVEASYGVGEGPTWQNQKGVIVPTIIMSLVGGGAAQGVSAAARYRTAKLLQDPARDPEQRLIAARNVAGAIHQQDPELAKLFLGEAQNLIAARKPVIAEGDQFYRDLKPLAQREEDQRMAAGEDMPSEEARTAAFGEAPADVPRGTEIPPEAFAQPEGAEAADTLATDENGDIIIEDGGDAPGAEIPADRFARPEDAPVEVPPAEPGVPGVSPPTEQPITDAAAVAPPQEPQAVEPAPLAAPAENGSTLQGEMVEPLNPEARKQHMNAIGANLKVLRAERDAAKKAGDEALMAEVDDEIQATAVNFKRLANNQPPLPTPREQAQIPQVESEKPHVVSPNQDVVGAALPKNDGIDLADEQPVKALDDERMQDPDFRNWMEQAVGGLVSVKDGNLGLAVDPNFIKGESDRGDEVRMVRAGSVNPPWFQEIAAAENVSVDGLRGIVKKAMTGAKLGVRQDRAVRKLMDAITDERIGELQDWGRGLGMSAEEVAGLHNDNPVAHMRALEAEVSARQKKAADAEVEQQWAEQDAVVAGKKPFTPDVVLGEDAVDLEGVDFSEAGQIASQVYATAAGWGVPIAQLDELHAQAPDAESFLSSVRTAIQEIRANEKARSERDKAGSLADIGGQGAPESGESAAAEAERLAAIEQARAEAIPALEEYLGTDWRKDNERRARLAAASPDELVEEVYRDKMTGLLNKRAWNEDVVKAGFEKEGRRSKPSTIAYIDLDGLKFLNDEMGHAAGDELLANFGAAMKAAGIDGYHISGDEFGAIFDTEAEAREAMSRLEQAVASSVVRGKSKDGRGITNAGIAFSYGVGPTADAADMAMQANKADREAQGLRGAARGGMPATASYDVLEQYDQADIDAKAAADKKRETDEAKAAARQKADDERGGFTLAGSNRPADQAAARGQNELFGATPPKAKPAANTIFTEEAAEKARAILRAKLGQVNTGIDPEIVQAGIALAGYHIEKGARTFSAYAKAMLDDMGEIIRPYLKSWYAAVKMDPRATGFEGMDSLAAVEAADVDAIGAKAPAAGPLPVRVFASGMSRIGDLAEAFKAGNHVGVDAGQLSARAVETIAKGVVETQSHVFVDSGAFSLFRANLRAKARHMPLFDDVAPEWKELDFGQVLGKYDQILDAVAARDENDTGAPARLHFVMPDVIGNQEASLEVLRQHADRISDVGIVSNRIFPLQAGDRSLLEMYDEIVKIVGRPDIAVGIPSNAEAAPTDQVEELLRERGDEITGIHFLGAGSEKTLAPRMEAVLAAGYDGDVSGDSNILRSKILGSTSRAEAMRAALADMSPDADPINAAAHEAATSPQNDTPHPTEGQKEAGNYKKGHVTWNGLDITIENPAGSKRRPEWPTLQSHYGYLKRTEGADGEHVDVFLNPSYNRTDSVVIIDQLNGGKKDGGFDEHKVMLGFSDKATAITAYKANFTKGWHVGKATEMTLDEFKDWLANGDLTVAAADLAGKGTAPEHRGNQGKPAKLERAETFASEQLSIDTRTYPGVRAAGARAMTYEGRASDGKPIMPGDVFATSSGRQTTPYPKQKGEKFASRWLIDNAAAEAEARGDLFNSRAFRATTPLKSGHLTDADRTGMLEYLFGEQPPVVPSVLKPLGGAAAEPAPAWHTEIPAEGLELTEAQRAGRAGAYEALPGLLAADAFDAITQTQRLGGSRMYLHVLPAANGRNGIARLFPQDQKPPAPWILANAEDVPHGTLTREQTIARMRNMLRNAPIVGDEKAAKPKAAPAGNAEADLANMSADDLSAMFDEIANETDAVETQKPARKRSSKPRSPKAAPRRTKSPAETSQSGGRPITEAAKSLGVNLSSAGSEALEGLAKLFGGPNRLNTGLSFDEETYAQAKPHFQTMMADFKAAGRDVRDLVREIIRLFGTGVKPYLMRYAQELQDAERGRGDVERDRNDAENGDGALGSAGRDGPAGNGGRAGEGNGEDRPDGEDGADLRDGGAAPDGERGDQSLDSGERPAAPPGDLFGFDDDRGGDSAGGPGVQPDRDGEEGAAPATGAGSLAERVAAQRRADSIPLEPGLDNIKATLPLLLEGQQEDVHTAETRYAKPDGYGMLFANGTGTGKTFTGLGIVKRFARAGKNNILVVVPDDKIMADWIESADLLGLKISELKNTKDAGKGTVITTYKNAGDNNMLADREWDLVVGDEAHYLTQNKVGGATDPLDTVRAITLHPRGAFRRAQMLHRDLLAEIDRLNAILKSKASTDMDDVHFAHVAKQERAAKELDPLLKQWRAAMTDVENDVLSRQGASRPRALFLSATPFAYEKSVDWAEGYLFDYEPPGQRTDSSRYNSGDARERFFVQHFGYRMRYNKLTEPDAKVDRGIMQRQFNAWLKQQGVMANRMLDVDADYDRRFVLIESAVGRRIDDALEWVRLKGTEEGGESEGIKMAFAELEGELRDQFDYLSRRYLLEAIKATEAVQHVREHMALGRKVVVFHDYNKGGGFNPFALPARIDPSYMLARAMFNEQYADLIEANLHELPSPIDVFRREFPGVLVVNGREKKADILARYRRFNDDATGPQVMLVQAAKAAGWSGHDTTGKHQRVLLNLGQPTQPTRAIQQEGRIYRTGQVSNAIMRYFNTGTSWERWTFATTIADRASAAENLAMGESARALKDSFIEAFEDSANFRAGHEGEGTGGKARDRLVSTMLSEWDRAKAMYFSQRKRNSKNKSEEGVDYFATPEPLGLKMTQWADVRPGEAALEPSAGHGAIARWIREDAERTAIEPSGELRSRLALVFGGGKTKIHDGWFENLHVVNKFDAIVMNPPFGTAGRKAIDHLAKAATHLRDGGRIVALIPTGPSADAKFDKWFYEEDRRPVSPLFEHPSLGPVYRGDTVQTRASWAKEAVVVRKDRAGTIYLKVPGEPTETTVGPDAWISVRNTGPKTEAYRPADGLHKVADIKLPSVTFQRAGTSVAARIVVLEKPIEGTTPPPERDIDLTGIEDIERFFERLENIEIAPRARPVEEVQVKAKPTKPASTAPGSTGPDGPTYTTDAPEITYTTKKGKELKGVIATDLTIDQAKAIDPYTWKMQGGYFIRMKHVVRPDVAQAQGVYLVNGKDTALREPALSSVEAPPAGRRGVSLPAPNLDLFAPNSDSAADIPAETARQQSEENHRILIEQVEARRFASAIGTVKTPEDAAHVLMPLAERAQEEFLALVTTPKGKILHIIGHAKGNESGASVYPGLIAGAIAATDGATDVWLAHNHPAGKSEPSNADLMITRRLSQAFKDMGVSYKGHIILGDNEVSFLEPGGYEYPRKITPTAGERKRFIPVTERVFRKRGPAEQLIASPNDGRRIMGGAEGSGILLLDNQHGVIGWLQMSPDEMRALKGNEFAGVQRLLRTFSRTGTVAFMARVNGKRGEAHQAAINLASFAKQYDVRMLDALIDPDEPGALPISMAEQGALSPAGTFYSRGAGAVGHTEAGLYDRLRKLFGAKFMDRLFAAGRFRVISAQDADAVLGAGVLESGAGDARGFFNPADGITYLVADGIPQSFTDDQLRGLMRHELGIHALNAGRDSKGWQAILGEIDRLVKVGDTVAVAAMNRAQAAGTPAGQLLEEVAGYLVEDAPSASIVRRILAWLKDQVYKLTGLQLKLTDADVVAMAQAALRAAPRALSARASASMVAQPAYSAPAPVWVSALKQRIAEQGAKTRTGNDWSAWLQGNAAKLGIKKDEIEWSGITDYLAARGKDKLTTAEITDWLGANGVQVQEVTLGDQGVYPEGSLAHPITGYVQTREEWRDEIDPDELEDEGKTEDEALDELIDVSGDPVISEYSDTKFEQYQLPGGENYRELLLTLPTGKAPPTFEEFEAAYRKEHPGASEGSVHREHNRVVRESQESQFRNGHWEEPNVLAHVRFNERADADGRRVLFIEEIQSDWAQKGRKEGFVSGQLSDQPMKAIVNTSADQPYWEVRTESGVFVANVVDISPDSSTPEQAIASAREIARTRNTQRGTPSAPFVTDTKAWTALALKRMTRYAVDNGFEAIAWTTGGQQKDRYSLAKQLSTVEVDRGHNDYFKIDAYDKSGDQVIFGKTANEDTLPNLVGKELAEKMIAAEPGRHTFSGLDLEVGGEGMHAFYDGIVPQVARDLLKKIGGGGVESITFAPTGTTGLRGIPGVTPMQAFDQRGVEGAQPGFAITDRMREIAGRGLPMFSRRTVRQGRIRRTIDDLIAAAESQKDWRDWYKRHEDTLIDLFGNDADLFQKILSATSQIQTVPGNVTMALRAYEQYLSGAPFTGYLSGVIKNLDRIRANEEIRGPKIADFQTANAGDERAMAVDRHIAMVFFNTTRPNARQIAAAKTRIITVADRMGWTPRQVQAALWAYNQIRLGKDPSKVRSYDKILEERADFIAELRSRYARGEGGSLPPGRGTDARGQEAGPAQGQGEVEALFSRASPEEVDQSRRRFVVGMAAVGAALTGGAYVEATAGDSTRLGQAQTLADGVLKERLSPAIEALLRGNGNTAFDGAQRVRKALETLATSGPESVRALAGQLAALMPADGLLLTIDDQNLTNAHGSVELAPLPHMTLYAAEGRNGLTLGTFLHESMHVAAVSRYHSLSMGVLRHNDTVLGMPAPKAELALAQFRSLWNEFQAEAKLEKSKDKALRLSLGEASRTPDEFFVRSLTDGTLRGWMATREYKGKTLLERFKDWVKFSLFGLKKTGTVPSWLDAALAGTTDLLRDMAGDAPNFARTDAILSLSDKAGGAMFSRAAPPGAPQRPTNPVQGAMVPPAAPVIPPQQGAMGLAGGATGPGATFSMPGESLMDTVIYRLQDKLVDLKRVQQAIKAAGRQISEAYDAYQKEELFHGRAATRTKEFLEDELDPLVADMRARGVSQEDLGRFLWARHAREANEHIANINPELPDGGSGMLTQEAQDYLDALTPQQQADFAALAARVDAITQTTRNALVNDKLISAQQRQDWESAYQHYVPLFRELEGNDTADLMTQGAGTGQGYSIKGAESKRRTGSQLPVADILGNIANARDKAIVRGEKARVGRALYALALTNKNPDFWRTAVAAPTIKTHDKNGMVIEIPDPLFKQRDNVVVVKVPTRKGNIVERAVIFNERDPRAARMARAIKNLDGQQLGEFLGATASVTRYFASINTQYNPIFGVVNLIRDVQTAMLNLSSTPLAGKQAAVAADMARIVAGAMKHGLRDFDGPWKAIAREFEEAGGMTGYRDMFRTGQERTEAIEKALDPNWWQKRPWGRALTADGYLKAPAELMVDKGVRPVMEWLSDYNQVLENATRLAAYKQARDSGLSKDASASIAKNLTVNFNRKGEMALQLGALYAFFNAATQGIARMGQTFAGPAGKYIVGGGVLAGVLQAMLLAAAGYDDEEPPQFVRERALILPTPWNKDRYVSIPMPLGFHVLPNFGRLIVEAMRTGDLMGKTASMMGIMADAFNPLGGSAPVAQILSPTATDPFVALGMNKDWTGKPIAREDFSNLHPTPGFTRARDAAGAPARWLAKALNRLSGGTDYTQGLISPTPDQIEYLAGQLTGGIGREAIKASTTATSIVTGDELPMHKVPLIGRFYGSTEGQAPQANKFYANLKKLNEHGATVKGLRADRRNAEVMEYLRDNPDARLFEAAGKAERKVSELRARRRALAERDASKAELKRVDDLITAQMVQLNDRMKALSK